MNSNPRILFVDDEDSIRLTLSLMLKEKGFDVSVAASVQESLALIMREKFDVLIADLNIGTAGDGFTVVSAMRSTQPNALRLILTGYPDFETALKAIQQQVDEYLIKPTDIDELAEKLRTLLAQKRLPSPQVGNQRLAEIIRDNREPITASWLKLVNVDADIRAIPLNDRERQNYVPEILDAVVGVAEGKQISTTDLSVAAEHGTARLKQGYSIVLLIREGRFLVDALIGCIQENILRAQLSYFVPDLRRVVEAVQILLEEAVRSFLTQSAGRASKSELAPSSHASSSKNRLQKPRK
jgi:ActR/RegA family two-component response regulator